MATLQARRVLIVIASIAALSGCDGNDNNTNAPSPSLSVNCILTPSSGPAPLLTSFVVDTQGSTPSQTVFVEFGDGLSATQAKNGSHVYSNIGGYQFRATVSNGAQTASCSQNVNVTPPPPEGFNGVPTLRAKIVPSPATGPAPLEVHFNLCQSQDPEGDDLQFRYDYGDGRANGPVNGCSKDHVYAAGKYVALVCTTDGREGHEVCQAFDVLAL